MGLRGQKGNRGNTGEKGERGEPGAPGVVSDIGPIDCVGEFGTCNDDCEKVYQILRPAINGGKECKYKKGYKIACEPGHGNCPNELNLTTLYIVIAKIKSNTIEPIKPNSSEKSVNIKSVCFSGKNSK